jgi:hypothetical protein
MSHSFDGFDLSGFYEPTDECQKMIEDRIIERLKNMVNIRIDKSIATTEQAINNLLK